MVEDLTVGSICTGYGGFDMALSSVTPVSLSWVSEIDRHVSTLLEQRFPEVLNIGDINNAQPEPVDIITAGFPCQDISKAGHGAGIHGERSGLWWRIRDVISDIRPRYVLLENVSAILANGGPAVIGSLTEIGYNARWTTLRASDIGAPHRRERWFCFAWNTESGGRGEQGLTGTGQRGRPAGTVRRPSDTLPTPSAADGTGGHKCRGGDRSDELLLAGIAVKLLPTPSATNRSGNKVNNRGEHLLPGIAEELTSHNTGQPSEDGKLSWVEQHLPLTSADG